MQDTLSRLDFSRAKEAGAKCAEAVARHKSLAGELAKAEAEVADFQALRDDYNAAAEVSKKAAATNYRNPSQKNKDRAEEAERVAAELKARMEAAHPSVRAAHEALKDIRREIEEVDAATSKPQKDLSAALAVLGRNGALRTLEKITAKLAELGPLRAELEAFCNLCLDHGMARPAGAEELISRWRNSDKHRPELGGLVTMDPRTGQIREPDWLREPPASDAYALLRAAVETAVGIPGGPKEHPYYETQEFKRQQQRESDLTYARFASRQQGQANEAARTRDAAEAPNLRARVSELEAATRQRGYSA